MQGQQMAAQITDTLSTLEDQLVSRNVAPMNLVYTLNGSSLVVNVDTAANILAAGGVCDDWVVTFPNSTTALNVPSLSSGTLIRCSLICFEVNPYAYSDNFDSLVTSGALLANLKYSNGTVIPFVFLSRRKVAELRIQRRRST